jgi:hypothetical protein
VREKKIWRLEKGKMRLVLKKGSLIFSQNRGGWRLPCIEDKVRENFRVFLCGLGFSPSIAKFPPSFGCIVTSIYRQSGLVPKTHRSFNFFIFCKF